MPIIAAAIALVIVFTSLTLAFAWYVRRPQMFTDPTYESVQIQFVPPRGGKRPTKQTRAEHSRLRSQAVKRIPCPNDVLVPTDMFWDELLGKMCFVSEEPEYQEELKSMFEHPAPTAKKAEPNLAFAVGDAK